MMNKKTEAALLMFGVSKKGFTMSSEKSVKSLKCFAEEISAYYPFKSMYLFGSRAVKKKNEVGVIMEAVRDGVKII